MKQLRDTLHFQTEAASLIYCANTVRLSSRSRLQAEPTHYLSHPTLPHCRYSGLNLPTLANITGKRIFFSTLSSTRTNPCQRYCNGNDIKSINTCQTHTQKRNKSKFLVLPSLFCTPACLVHLFDAAVSTHHHSIPLSQKFCHTWALRPARRHPCSPHFLCSIVPIPEPTILMHTGPGPNKEAYMCTTLFLLQTCPALWGILCLPAPEPRGAWYICILHTHLQVLLKVTSR